MLAYPKRHVQRSSVSGDGYSSAIRTSAALAARAMRSTLRFSVNAQCTNVDVFCVLIWNALYTHRQLTSSHMLSTLTAMTVVDDVCIATSVINTVWWEAAWSRLLVYFNVR
ncbi:hypothetical protein PMIN07_007909 [Paraphaeosphaeria minitans]